MGLHEQGDGGRTEPNVRSRLVARKSKVGRTEDFFDVAMPHPQAQEDILTKAVETDARW